MFKQTMIAASTALMTTAMAASTPAQADVHIGFGFGHGFGPYYGSGVHFVQPGFGRYSCREGRRMVRRSGFRRVRAIECNGKFYTYRARSAGERLKVRFDARFGEIVSVRRF